MSEPNKRVSWLLERQKPGPSEHLSAGSSIPCDVTSKHVNSKQTFTAEICREACHHFMTAASCVCARARAGSAEACRWQQRTVKEGGQETSPLNIPFLYFTLQITHRLQGSKRFKTCFPLAIIIQAPSSASPEQTKTTTNRVIIIINDDKTH